MPPSPPPDDLLGQTISGRYRIISRLGAGGMGVAYRAWDEEAGLPVVIKIPKKAFLEDPTFAERFAREIRLLQGLDHPHVVPVVDVGVHDGLPFVVMRFLPGGSLSNRRLRGDDGRTKSNPSGMLHLWLPAVAEALDYVHQSGVVHRDVKPANIFFDAFWGAFLGDFGIAKVVAETTAFDREATLTATSMGVGTPDYMAPELFTPKAKLDGRTDQYALAVITYEMLAGTRPFTGDVAQVYVAIATQQPPRLDQQVAGLPPSLVDAVHRGLAKRPADRFPSCRQFATALLRDVPRLEDEPDTARFLCPSCANLLKLPVTAAGRKGKCPKCKEEMKVAGDLGALWLIDEVRRQQTQGVLPGNDGAWTVDQDDEASVTGVADSTSAPLISAPRSGSDSRRGILKWINAHGLVAATALTVAALLPYWLRFRSQEPLPAKPDAQEMRALHSELQEAGKREDELKQRLAELQATVTKAQARAQELEMRLAIKPRPAANEATIMTEPSVEVVNSIGMKLRLLQAGIFMMGSEDGDADEKPAHQVRITRPFYIGLTEVTNDQWKQVMRGEPPSKWKDDDHPVEQVSWDDALKFCSLLSAMPAEKLHQRTYRLPTEAEWEYACRAGTATRWASGNNPQLFETIAWCGGNSGGKTHPVGGKHPNAWGLYDMHGNVWEWCSDWHGVYGPAESSDPQGPSTGLLRCHRGGCWDDDAWLCRSANRNAYEASNRYSGLGFRVVLCPPASVPPEAQSGN